MVVAAGRRERSSREEIYPSVAAAITASDDDRVGISQQILGTCQVPAGRLGRGSSLAHRRGARVQLARFERYALLREGICREGLRCC